MCDSFYCKEAIAYEIAEPEKQKKNTVEDNSNGIVFETDIVLHICLKLKLIISCSRNTQPSTTTEQPK